ncbi:TAXI family TRAP transporter solute-binding subunit [Azospirillum sp. SYSU D00513]|uniref:TAXI family TRAP transporter solute-binding subunit n=1 Tax=Azospirillum sp. SYSU D00513 TaxID=2812561 RepID=UPI0032B3CF08
MQRAAADTRSAFPVSAAAPVGRRRLLGLAAGGALLGALGPAGRAMAQDVRYFRIATGTTSGTYFPMGGLIANAISSPPGARACDRGGSCGVPGLIAVAQATSGSVENIELLRNGTVEACLCQADIAYWAYNGSGRYANRPPFEGLRSIGMLYAEALHLVVAADSGIHSVQDLKGRIVSLGEEGSGTLVEARLVLEAFGVRVADVQPVYQKPGTSADWLGQGKLEAFFMVGGPPVAAIADVAARVPIRLIPLDGEEAGRLRAEQRFFMETVVPAGSYAGVPETRTLGLGAELLVRADGSPDLIFGICSALWHENTRRLLVEGHPRGRSMDRLKALAGLSVPLHPGAERYYRKAGLLGNAANEPSANTDPGGEPPPPAPAVPDGRQTGERPAP